jgi:hypothetical protein
MLGSKPGRFWIITWCGAAPIFLGVSIIAIRLPSPLFIYRSLSFVFKCIILSGLIQHVHPSYGKLTDPFYYEVRRRDNHFVEIPSFVFVCLFSVS